MSYFPIFWDIETTGLNPMIEPWSNYGKASQVTAVGLGCIDNWHDNPTVEEAEFTVYPLWDSDEYNLIQVATARVREMAGEGEPILCGYNSYQYDHPYFSARAGRKRLDPEPFASEWRRLDMMRAAGSDPEYPNSYPSEDDYAEFLGIEDDDPYTGKDMPGAFERGDWDAIETHVHSDVLVSMEMFLIKKDLMMQEFFDHYDIDAQGAPVEEIELNE